MPNIQNEHKSREAFESLWIKSNGHFKYFVFSQEHGKYIHTGVRDNLTDQELLFASITLNTAYLFFIGGVKTQAMPKGFVLVNKECSDEMAEVIATTANVCGGIANDIYDAVIGQAVVEAMENNREN